MYQDHFGLHADPFSLSPSLRFLYRSQAHAETMAHLGYGLEQGEDIILITGAIGTGKTLAVQNLMAKVSRLFAQVLVNITQVSYVEFLKLVLDEMGETWPDGADAADLLVRMKRRARAEHAQGRKILLVIDEAQNLDLETLEGVRLLTNLGQPDNQLFQIVLVGQPALDDLVERPELAQLRQRIRVHYRLEPLTEKETAAYIEHRTSVAGARQALFTAAAVRRIHQLSGGIPRLVNHLAGHALLAAFVDKDRRVDAHHVAAEGLPETPTPAKAGVGREQPAAGSAAPPEPEPEPEPAPGAESGPEPEPMPAPDPPPAPTSPPEPERPAPTVAPRPSTRRRQADAGPRSRRRVPVAVWIWALILLAGAAGAWYLLGDTATTTEPTADLVPPPPAPADESPGVAVAAAEPAAEDAAPTPERSDASAGTTPADVAPSPGDAGEGAPAAGSSPEPGAAAEPAAAAPHHWLHVASFREADRAARFQARLAAAGVEAEQRTVTLDGGQVWLRVLVGPFADAGEAAAAARELEADRVITFHRLLSE